MTFGGLALKATKVNDLGLDDVTDSKGNYGQKSS
jgi:hypothetical protein